MKAQIHPQYNANANVVCSCGAKFTVGSVKDQIHVELCDTCHPFYTGKQRFVDAASRIDKFKKKQDVAAKSIAKKKDIKNLKEEEERQPQTLQEMLQAIKKQ
jgi:large subunit ribosomal protein L31